jgi:hypothetical protein
LKIYALVVYGDVSKINPSQSPQGLSFQPTNINEKVNSAKIFYAAGGAGGG